MNIVICKKNGVFCNYRAVKKTDLERFRSFLLIQVWVCDKVYLYICPISSFGYSIVHYDALAQ